MRAPARELGNDRVSKRKPENKRFSVEWLRQDRHCWQLMRFWLLFFLTSVGAIFVAPNDAQAFPRLFGKPRPTPTPTLSGKVGRVIVQRAVNFGTDLSIRLSIDGKRAADIPRNQHYGGVLAAGRHVLTALVLPNTESRRPTSIKVTIKPGQVYIFTAAWESDRLVLRPSNFYSPTVRANAR